MKRRVWKRKRELLTIQKLHTFLSNFHAIIYSKYRAREYVFDVDSNNVWIPHDHDKTHVVCRECLWNSKRVTLHIAEAIEENYSKIQIVFSGRRGARALTITYTTSFFLTVSHLTRSIEMMNLWTRMRDEQGKRYWTPTICWRTLRSFTGTSYINRDTRARHARAHKMEI